MVTLQDTSDRGPALAGFGAPLYIAWKGNGETFL
jgi:hypothetical protein